ncbi:MAG TPA: hypothetical protein VJN69_05385 [Candidatus Acidoferrales bacterium]|nr:hypothetical protein [Candidatus Acidoferrales bacterium]
MATNGIALWAQQTPPMPVQPDSAPGPQANAAPAQDPGWQDVVTLTGRTAENGETRTANDNAQFGEAAAFFFAEQQSFRAANGSGASQTAQIPDAPELPVKLTHSVPNQRSGDPLANDLPSKRTPPAANDPARPAAESVAENQTRSAISAASQPASTASHTPLAELAQLNHTLQQIGIDPQSISLFNRMAMLLYANDPAALKMLVQTLQSGAQELATDSNTTTNQAQIGAEVQMLFAGQTPSARVDSNEEPKLQLRDVAQRLSPVHLPQTQLAMAGFESNGPERPPRTGPHYLSNLSSKMSDLKLRFATVDAPQLDSAFQSTPPGQLLNITI